MVVGLERCPLKVRKKLATSPLRINGILSGLGTTLSTTYLSKSKTMLLMTGVRDSFKSPIIFSEGFY